MLDELELIQVRDYVSGILPDILPEEPKIRTTIEGIVPQEFPRRDEFDRLLNEFVEHRQETSQQFDDVNHRFDEVDDRFARVDARFDQVERKLETHRRETKQRFDQVDQRFDKMDERFDKMDERFDKMDERFDKMDERFDEHGTRLTKVERDLLYVRRDIAKLQAGQEGIIRRLDIQDKWLKVVTGHLGDEKGERLEDVVAAAMRYGLENPEISPESIRLRQNLVDREGFVFKRGFKTEVDLIALEHKLMVFKVFEVKATAKAGDVDLFALKVELIAHQNPDKEVQGILITLGASQEVRDSCAEHGLLLVP